MASSNLHVLPILSFILLPGTFIGTFSISYFLDHVYLWYPCISDTGSLLPESCFFSLFLNITAAIMLFTIYIRSKMVKEFFRVKGDVRLSTRIFRMNFCSTVSGLVGCLGLDVAANFQEVNVIWVHYIGLMVYFWGYSIYIFLQGLITYSMCPELNSVSMASFRIAIGVIAICVTILNQTVAGLAASEFPGNSTDILYWNSTDPGWKWHETSGAAEWVLILIFSIFLLTYTFDFKKLILYDPEITMKTSPIPSPVQARRITLTSMSP